MSATVSLARGLKRWLANTEEDLRVACGRITRPFAADRSADRPELFEERPLDGDGRRLDERYGDFPLQCVSPGDGHYMHSFFDVPPVSVSGRFLLLSRIPFVWRLPLPGDSAELCVVDLENRTFRVVYRSQGWGMQLGINAHWHPASDDIIYCNDLIDGEGRAVVIDLAERTHRQLDGPLYAVGADGRHVYGPSLTRINHSQDGYGVPLPSRRSLQVPAGLSRDDGIWRTDVATGRRELLVSIHDLAAELPDRERLRTAVTTLFHLKINAAGDRFFQVMRHTGLPDRPFAVRSRLLGLDVDGGHVRQLVSVEDWDRGGHHPNWIDNRHILMNLAPASGEPIRFVRIDGHTGERDLLAPDARGSGHPSLRHGMIVSDCYHHEGFVDRGPLPLRLIDPVSSHERTITGLDAGPRNLKARRIDAHPVWSRSGDALFVNCWMDGLRQTLRIDMTALLDNPGPAPHPPSPAPFALAD